MKGWIYFASNDSLYGLLKIGFTERDPKLRISELSNTSVPTEFQLIYSAMIERADEVEQLLHKELEKFRVNMSREFFNCDHKQAQNYLLKILTDKNISILYEEVNGIIHNGIITILDLLAIKKEIIKDIKNKFKEEKKKFITDETKIDDLLDDEIYLLEVIETFTDTNHLNDYLDVMRTDKNYLNNIKKEVKIEFAKNYIENQIKLWWVNYPNIKYQTLSSRNNSSIKNNSTINESTKFLEKLCSKCGSSNVFHSTGNFSYHCQNCNFRFS